MISVDTKKKELIGDYANGGAEWQPAGEPDRVNVHDFVDRPGRVAKAIPYGIYDVANDEGWVQSATPPTPPSSPSSRSAAGGTRWAPTASPHATRLLDHRRCRRLQRLPGPAWKVELARLAAETGLEITVCHYPPGTSKWNRIEHRMFSFITMNWRGRPLTSYRTIIELIAATTTKTGLTIKAKRDTEWYPTGVKITDRTRRPTTTTARVPRRLELHPRRSIKPALSPNGRKGVLWRVEATDGHGHGRAGCHRDCQTGPPQAGLEILHRHCCVGGDRARYRGPRVARRVGILGRVDHAAWYSLISPPRIACRRMVAIVAGFGGINATGMGGRNARPRWGRCSL